MFKLSKSTHLTVIATFAIVFIVIYLYYTITDLRKLQIEVSKLSKQVQSLQAPVCAPQPTMVFTPIDVSSAEPPVAVVQEDDCTSVATEEIKNMIDESFEDTEQVQEVETVPTGEPEEAPVKPARARKSKKP